MLNPLAKELNDALAGTVVSDLISDLGKRIYFPKGIIAQSGEAKKYGTFANATIGMTVIEGKPAALPSVQALAPKLSSGELVAYAPTAGNVDLRNLWKSELLKKNPGLNGKNYSLPIVVPGLTAGLSYLSDLFIDEEKPLLAADPSWDNYKLIVEARRNSELHQFPMFAGDGFNIEEFEKAMNEEAKRGSIRVLLNFPQNPSGYSPTKEEVKKIVSIVKGLAEKGVKILTISDDAYFGLNYEENIYPQSLFAEFADLHENVLAVKVDGPTKEDFVWGFRCGFLTFASKNLSEEAMTALTTKMTGIIRSSVSCSGTPAQSIILKAFDSGSMEAEKLHFRSILENRYKIVRAFVNAHHSEVIEPLPFNSGYFMSFNVKGVDAEEIRSKLLKEKGIGTVSIDSKTLRVAFSSLDEGKINDVYQAVYDCADSFKK